MPGERLRILTLFVGASIVRMALAQSADSVLVVENVTLTGDGTTARLDLRNTSEKTITAYAMTGTASSDPSIVDYFASVGMEPWVKEAGGIRGGEAVPANVVKRGVDLPIVRVVAVVFADRTAVGDERQITRIFRARAGAAAEMVRWCEMVTPQSLKTIDRASVSSALSDMIAKIHEAPAADAPDGDGRAAAVKARQDLLSKLEQRAWAQDPSLFVVALRSHCAAIAVHSRREGVK